MRFGCNFWLGDPIDLKPTHLNCILQDLLRDIQTLTKVVLPWPYPNWPKKVWNLTDSSAVGVRRGELDCIVVGSGLLSSRWQPLPQSDSRRWDRGDRWLASQLRNALVASQLVALCTSKLCNAFAWFVCNMRLWPVLLFRTSSQCDYIIEQSSA